MSWFGERRAIVELKKQRFALERIATSLEELLLRQGSPNSLRSFYKDAGNEEAGVVDAGDEFFAEQERLDEEKRAAGLGEDE